MINLPLRPEKSHFTDGQWQAIYDGNSNLLVSASAGSGKTTVLVQRVIEKIKNGQHVDELLIVTYTEAAAKEMKERILVAVQNAISEEKNEQMQRHLVEQLTKIPNSSISTLHSFCLKVIRKYYYLIDIDPVFRLLTDETEMILLKEEVWSNLRESYYETNQLSFYQVTENFSNDRSDTGLENLVLALYDFSRAKPNPDEWLTDLATLYDVKGELSQWSLYQEQIKPNLLKELKEYQALGDLLVSRLEIEPLLEKPYSILKEEVDVVKQLKALLTSDNLTACYDLLKHYKFKTYAGPRGKNVAEEIKEQFQSTKEGRNEIKAYLQSLAQGFFGETPEQQVALLEKSKPFVALLGEITKDFSKAYKARKMEKNMLDFNDLEHLTLAILRQKNAMGFEASIASQYYQEQFHEVLVDEYQDINQLQENILSWLSSPNEPGNLFMVGDVKQSIYSFRLADPTLFINKYNAYATETGGRRIVLAENFRSRKEVLSFTNYVFKQLMNTAVGQLEYDQQAQLVLGATDFPESDKNQTEILIYESGKDDSEETESVVDETEDFSIDSKTEGEIRLIASKIKQLKAEGFTLYDRKQKKMRQMQYKDIVILTPTKKNNLVLLDIFKELGVPLYINDTQNYFQTTEVKVMMSLLTIIDNPHQDIPFVSVLRSPIVGLKENDLATIRATMTSGNFYEAAKQYTLLETADYSLQQKLIFFFKQLNDWRELARKERLVTLIWHIYQETDLLDYMAGLPSGKQRQANLHALYDRAMRYEETSFRGLFQFVRFIEKMQEHDKDLASPSALGESEDAVRVMTIHASKGLEFPVVFIMDLNRRFNLRDVNQKYVFDEEQGIGVKYLDTLTRVESETLPFQLIKLEKKKKLLAEEMRKLYVGLTRAEEKLFLVGSYESEEKAWKKWLKAAENKETVLNDALRLEASTLLDWIGFTLIRHQEVQKQLLNYAENIQPKFYSEDTQFHVHFYRADDLIVPVIEVSDTLEKMDSLPDLTAVSKAKELLAFQYPFEAATHTASYQSVSEIKRIFEDPDKKELLTLEFIEGTGQVANRFVESELAKPAFIEKETQVTASMIGTATHEVLQLIPLTQEITKENIQQLIKELVAKKVITIEVAKRINSEQLLAFFATEFGQKIITHAEQLKREQPFSMLMNAKEIYHDYPETQTDEVLIHGVIDGYIETLDELILYDFKTDYLPKNYTEEDIKKIANKYKGQLHLYKRALEGEKKRAVTSVKLILLQQQVVLEML